ALINLAYYPNGRKIGDSEQLLARHDDLAYVDRAAEDRTRGRGIDRDHCAHLVCRSKPFNLLRAHPQKHEPLACGRQLRLLGLVFRLGRFELLAADRPELDELSRTVIMLVVLLDLCLQAEVSGLRFRELGAEDRDNLLPAPDLIAERNVDLA